MTDFIKQQQEEAKKFYKNYYECKDSMPEHELEDLTAQIIKKTCEEIQKKIAEFEIYEDEPDNCRRLISEIRDLLTQHNNHDE